MLETLMHVFRPHHRVPPVSGPPIDRAALRDELTRTDPDFARVRQAHHDALQALQSKSIRDGLSLRHEREFWTRHGEQGKK